VVDDGTGTAHRFRCDENGSLGFFGIQAMVVDNLHDIGFVQTLDTLVELIVVDHDDFASGAFKETTPRHKANEPLVVENRQSTILGFH
jgi:hypothetical protein